MTPNPTPPMNPEVRDALENAVDFIERVNNWTGSDPDECHELLDELNRVLEQS